MIVDDQLIAKLEKLSHLEIHHSKKEHLKQELADILNFVDNLNEIDISDIDATFTTVEGGTPLRKDQPQQNKALGEHILKHAPKSEENCFIVPKIIE